MTAVLRCIAVSLFIVLTAGQCQRPDEAGVGQTEDGTLQVGTTEATASVQRGVAPGDRRLVFDGYRGSVSLAGTTATTAELTFTKRGRAGDTAAAQGLLDDVSITESGTAEAYTYQMESDAEAQTSVDVAGTVPQATALRIEKDSGPVRIGGVTGPITVRQKFGDIRLRGAAAAVDVNTQTGDIDVQFRQVPADAKITLRTANGDLALGLPSNASVQVDAQTDAGAVQTRGLDFGPQRLTPVRAGARYTAQMGGGDTVIELATENGTITLTGTAPAPPDTTAPEPAVPDTVGGDTPAPDTAASEPTPPDERPAPAPDTTAPSPTPTPDTTDADTTQAALNGES